jgi:hypothetical protein
MLVLVLVLVLALLTAAAAARAQAPDMDPGALHELALRPPDPDPRRGPRLVYSAPPGCPDERFFRDEVASALDALDHFDARSPERLRATVEKAGGQYRVRFVHTDAAGNQEARYSAADAECRWAVHLAASFAGFTYIPPKPDEAPKPAAPPATAPDEAPKPAAPPATAGAACHQCTAPAAPTSTAPPPATPPVKARAGWLLSFLRRQFQVDVTIAVSGYALVAAGFAANPQPGFGLGVDVRGSIFSLGLELRGIPPGTAHATQPLDPTKKPGYPQDLDVSLWTVAAVPCARWRPGGRPDSVALLGCGVAQVGAIVLGGDELTSPVDVEFGPRLGLEIPFAQRFALIGFGEALFVPAPVVLDFNHGPTPQNVVWRQSIVSGLWAGGLVIKFD